MRHEWSPDSIRTLRQSLGDTQRQFADRLGLERLQTVSEYEKARRTPSGTVCRLLDFIARDANRARAAVVDPVG